MTHLSIRPALTAAAALGLALSWSAGAQTGDPAPAEATVDAAALYNTGAAVIENSREEAAAGAQTLDWRYRAACDRRPSGCRRRASR